MMRLPLARQVLRNKTAYRGARLFVDVLLGLQVAGMVILSVALSLGDRFTPNPVLAATGPFAGLFMAAVVVNVACSIVIRCVIHAIFDIADVALQSVKVEL